VIIDTHAYTRPEWQVHVNGLTWDAFSAATKRPLGICLHNTWRPTIASWTETDPRRINGLNGLRAYYEGMGWHAGPHAFISRQFINGFSPLTAWGIHSTCFNHTHIGLEMIGNYAAGAEPFDSGDGAMVRDNAVFAVAVLMAKLGLAPERDLVFHRDCSADHHDCPGSGVGKPEMVARVRGAMNQLADATEMTPAPPAPVLGKYTVQPGDTLYRIALKFGTTFQAIALANHIPGPMFIITPGQVLNIP